MRAHLVLFVGIAGAGFLTGTVGAHAVDRPGVNALRSCPQHGPGFVEVPGTTTCVRIGGRVRSEYQFSARRQRGTDASALRNSGQVSLDARSETPYGPIRTFVRVKGGQTNAFIQTR